MLKDKNIAYYIKKHENFSEILETLRAIVQKHPFEETIKWGMPTYVYENKNLVGLGAFKNHVGLWFFQGALLKDEQGILHSAQEEKTKAMRQVHFKQISDIDELVINDYLRETIENQKKDLKVKMSKPVKKVSLPIKLAKYLADNKNLSDSFFKLSPGSQKEYSEYISSAKRDQTKSSRLKKIAPVICQGKGLHDKYKK